MATTEKRRRQYGTGTVYQRTDGLWIGRYRNGYTRSGAVAYKSVSASTEKTCRAKLNKALAYRSADTATIDSRMTVKAWCDEWLPRQQKRVRPSGFIADRGAVRNWIVPNIGACKLAELTPRDIRKVHDAVMAKRAQGTAIRVHATLLARSRLPPSRATRSQHGSSRCPRRPRVRATGPRFPSRTRSRSSRPPRTIRGDHAGSPP